ncbi:competence protein ComK [Bacillus solimangrovi]|uniref:Competence protein n=1 Tax=Bacillus solimangrovi TaxID=1305675 RepID=A0A1E5LDL6_9BACI|nr:competence protein ComK [Bacillus solimangrovi]OEH92162.1 hypothetical protein BFG57_02510 [Bacillus solimangrovi]
MKSVKKKYMIHPDVEAIVPYYNDEGCLCSEVREVSSVKYVYESPKKLLIRVCAFYGGDYNGNRQAAKLILKAKQMLPLSISLIHNMMFIPMQSPKSPNCIWVNLAHIFFVKKGINKDSIILFKSGHELEVNLLADSVEKKRDRAAYLQNELFVRHVQTLKDGNYPSFAALLLCILQD